MDRAFCFLMVCCLHGGFWHAPAGAAETGRETPLRLVASGVLERRADPQGVRYALTDEQGNTIYHVAPAGRLELAAYVGQQVEIVGALGAGGPDNIREIRGERLELTDRIVPAHFIQADSAGTRSSSTAASREGRPVAAEAELTPIPEMAPRHAPAGAAASAHEPAPAFPEPPDLPPLMEGPLLNHSPLLDGPVIGDQGSLLLQPPTSAVPRGYDAYQDPAGRDPACGPPHRIWIDGQYLYWWTKQGGAPPLVTTSPPGTPQDDAGVLGAEGTEVLFGDGQWGDGQRDGWRWLGGIWLGPQRRLGLQLDYLDLQDDQVSFRAASNGLEILARPFFNVDPALGPVGRQDSELISYPHLTAGGVEVDAGNQFRSVGLHLRGNMLCKNGCFHGHGRTCAGDCSGYRLDLLGGYRYVKLDEELTIRQLTSVSVTPQAGFQVLDSFRTDNNFQGGELALLYEWYHSRWSFDGDVRLALGRTQQKVAIDGSTELSTAGIVTPFEGGLLAQSTNIGRYSRKQTDVIPELGLTVGYFLTSNLRVNCGYRAIYWPKVARAGDQIDMTVNGSYIPDPMVTPSGPVRPEFAFRDASFWAQGLSVGLDYRW